MNNWKRRAACRDEDGELFFPIGTTGTENLAQVGEAKRVCRRCPVSRECLQAAIDGNEKFGIWGGTTPEERVSLRRRARRANAA